MDSVNMDDSCYDLELVNRSMVYKVSRKILCASIPFFQNMLDSDLIEAAPDKVSLDLDNDGLNTILCKVYSNIYFLTMKNVVPTYYAADHLLMNDLKEECASFLAAKFSIQHLESIIGQLKPSSRPAALVDGFICRHFMFILHTKSFLKFSEKTMEHILRLDLLVDSEVKVYEAIMAWYRQNQEQRESSLAKLLGLVRWCHMQPEDLQRIRAQSSHPSSKDSLDVESFICSDSLCQGFCRINRTKSEHLIAVYRVNDETIGIFSIDSSDHITLLGSFTQDDGLSNSLFCETNYSDIVYDSDERPIRIDWKQRKYRMHSLNKETDSYYAQIYRHLVQDHFSESKLRLYLEEKLSDLMPGDQYSGDFSLAELNGKFVAVGLTKNGKIGYLSHVDHQSWFEKCLKHTKFKVTFTDGFVFMLDQDLNLHVCNLDQRTRVTRDLLKKKKLSFGNLLMTTDVPEKRVLFIDRESKQLYSYYIHQDEWFTDFTLNLTGTIVTLTKARLPLTFVKPRFSMKRRISE